MLIFTLEAKKPIHQEFEARHSGELGLKPFVSEICSEYGFGNEVQKANERVKGIYTLCRLAYNETAEAAYTIAFNALLACLQEGLCPSKAARKHYKG